MKRSFDLILGLIVGVLLLPIYLLIIIAIRVTSSGSAIHWSKRVGLGNKIFLMPKFRTMYIHAPQLATHLLKNPETYITPIGKFLRKTSLDEIPQLLSIIKGDMSFVGPRPALFNQDDLIALRIKEGVDKLKPGLTGWAQINGRDEIEISLKVRFDREYSEKMSFLFDLKIIFLTFFRVIIGSNIKH